MVNVGDVVNYDAGGDVVSAVVKKAYASGHVDLEVLESGRRVNSVETGAGVNQFTSQEA